MKKLFAWLNHHWEVYVGVAVFIVFCFLHWFVGLGVGLITWAVVRSHRIKASKKKQSGIPAASTTASSAHEEKLFPYEHMQIRVAGVTFKNGRRSRQTILRQIKFKDPPFDGNIDVRITEYEYEGNSALGVYVNDEQVGNIPADLVQTIIGKWDRIDTVSHFEVTGGGRSDSGDQLNFGALIYLRFWKVGFVPNKEETLSSTMSI